VLKAIDVECLERDIAANILNTADPEIINLSTSKAVGYDTEVHYRNTMAILKD